MSHNTPMMQQYAAIKANHSQHILFYRLGDFYEMFFEDAKIAANCLGITLTQRNKNTENPIPMAGIPYHAADNYIARLIASGHCVAICEQTSEPNNKGPVERAVTKIITPGTLSQDNLLSAAEDANLLAVTQDKKNIGIAWLDLAAGHFKLMQLSTLEEYYQEVARIAPAEILIPENNPQLRPPIAKAITKRPNWEFNKTTAIRLLTEQFQTLDLLGFDIEETSIAINAAGALLQYVQQTQKQALPHITSLKQEVLTEYLQLDIHTRQHLNLTNNVHGLNQFTLYNVLNKSQTNMGKRLLKRWINQPLNNLDLSNQRLISVETIIKNNISQSLQNVLAQISDIERITGRIALLNAKPRDLEQLKLSLTQLPIIIKIIEPIKHFNYIKQNIHMLTELKELLTTAIIENPANIIKDGKVIAVGFDLELDNLRNFSENSAAILENIESQEKQQTNLSSLKLGFNKIHGYYLELSKHQATQAPEHYQRRQTLKHAERYITPELKKFESQALSSQANALAREKQLYSQLLENIQPLINKLQQTSKAIATLDVLTSLSKSAIDYSWVKPKRCSSSSISIQDGKHPILSTQSTSAFIANDCNLETNSSLQCLTGPNMGGKSTYMRQTALITILAHIGSYVPAKAATIGSFDKIFTRIGANDDLSTGRSTFMVEMTEAAQILHNATQNSLALIDEIGRGTSTFDGMALAWAIAIKLSSIGCKTLFATHYFELTQLANIKKNIHNFHLHAIAYQDKIIFKYQVIPGPANQSYGIQVAKLAGIPQDVITNAKKRLANIEAGQQLSFLD